MPHHHGSSGTSAGRSQGSHSRSYNPGAGGVVQHGPTKTTTHTSSGKGSPHSGKGSTKKTINTNTAKNLSLGISVAKGNPLGVAWNILSRSFQKKTPAEKRAANIKKGLDISNPAEMHGYETRKQPKGGDEPGGQGITPCPDGRNPPCIGATSADAIKPAGPSPDRPYHMGFDYQEPMDPSTHRALPGVTYPYKKGGLSGGKRYGPPPKKGPNPHGKCPYRPDGIRGVGAVQPGRGVKFVGVK